MLFILVSILIPGVVESDTLRLRDDVWHEF